MDRLVKAEFKEVELNFQKNQKCFTSFKLTNLMHTMSVAVSLTTTNPSTFSINKPLSVIPPLSSSTYTLHLSNMNQPPLSDPADVITVRTSMLPTGKANTEDLRRLFNKPGPHVFRDAVITVTLVGPTVAEFIISNYDSVAETRNLFAKAISVCEKSYLTSLLKPAVESGQLDYVADLIAAGGDASLTDSNGRSLIPSAIRTGKLDVLKLLVASGSRINDSVDFVLHEAAVLDRIDIVKFLLEIFSEELDVNSTNTESKTPIHVAAMEGHVSVIQFLVSIGANPNAVDSQKWTPLHHAASRNHLKAVEFLLENSDVKYAKELNGKTAFELAEERDHTRLFGLLRWGDALLRAARVDDVHALKKCLAAGAEVNRKDQNGWTPLHWASFKGRIKSVKILLEHGAEVDSVDDAGYTPLHCAAEAGHLQVALVLIAHGGCQTNLKSFQHVSPIGSFQKHVSQSLHYSKKSEFIA
ncbi:protein VAPYRIN-LIKE-like [Trifolium pratense]|uniref:protein VAPYRIN-LIKE-like n=1 Tax=Trifolium pratense TaxID=57577 RepID=UPI001E691FEE|nr:protein VAPYRIN-LIKE-like [Trifolium pratense]